MEDRLSLIFSLTLVLGILRANCNPVYECKTYPVESKELYVPPLADIVQALKKNLTTTFQNVEVSIVDFPDLREEPFYLALLGLSGFPTILEGGNESYLMPTPDKSKVYDFNKVPQKTGVYPTFITGAGAGPFPYLKTASEVVANLNITGGQLHSLTQIGTIKQSLKQSNLHRSYSRQCVHLCFRDKFICQSRKTRKSHKKTKVSKRISEGNFPSSIRETLKKSFSTEINWFWRYIFYKK